ncbi:SDR family NAD(P)-dependent oxidoreductase [Candidatus Hodarchaeum mangrovi]
MKSKQILITGASSGLGLSHAIYLTYKGHEVIGTYKNRRDNEILKEIFLRDHTRYKYSNKKESMLKKGKIFISQDIQEKLDFLLDQITFIPLDVTKSQEISHFITNIDDTAIDVLINNAGIGYFGPVEESPIENWIHQFEVNVLGYVRMIQAILPQMRERRSGLIINTASMAGMATIPFQAGYSISKAGIIRLTDSLRTELKPFGIHVTTISPGDINTSFDAATITLHKAEAKYRSDEIASMIQEIPLQKSSPYYTRSLIVWTNIIQNLIISPPPMKVSKKITQVISTRNPKSFYTAGSLLQTTLLLFLQRIISREFFLWIIAKFYGV